MVGVFFPGQILVGMTDKNTHVLYDPMFSHHGALLTIGARKRKADVGAANVQP